jgi:oligopeptide/dipeptide ABC transporter ATP-binding protein
MTTEQIFEQKGPGVSAEVLELDGVERRFHTRHGEVSAVDGVSLTVHRGQTVGLVGESGSGKSTLGRVAIRMYDVSAGRVRFDGTDITTMDGSQLRRLRTHFQMVFQDPVSSLNPRMRVHDIVAEPLRELLDLDRSERRARVDETLDLVHLPRSIRDRYPRELSGGQAQRVGIARALSVRPTLVVADEPVASLDASVGAQIINLMAELQREQGVAYLFISHDLTIVRHLCDRVAVMYLGRIVEEGPTERLFSSPRHPYTAALLSSTPGISTATGTRRRRIMLPGEIPDPTAVPAGCRFRTRCPIGPLADPTRYICEQVDPPHAPVQGGGTSACHFAGDVASMASAVGSGSSDDLPGPESMLIQSEPPTSRWQERSGT